MHMSRLLSCFSLNASPLPKISREEKPSAFAFLPPSAAIFTRKKLEVLQIAYSGSSLVLYESDFL